MSVLPCCHCHSRVAVAAATWLVLSLTTCLWTVSAKMTIRAGTPVWMAPEVMKGGQYTEKADQYSYGLVLWEMMTNKYVFI